MLHNSVHGCKLNTLTTSPISFCQKAQGVHRIFKMQVQSGVMHWHSDVFILSSFLNLSIINNSQHLMAGFYRHWIIILTLRSCSLVTGLIRGHCCGCELLIDWLGYFLPQFRFPTWLCSCSHSVAEKQPMTRKALRFADHVLCTWSDLGASSQREGEAEGQECGGQRDSYNRDWVGIEEPDTEGGSK